MRKLSNHINNLRDLSADGSGDDDDGGGGDDDDDDNIPR